ncbi:GNAT family N-acetyltransferase [Kribbella sp. NBC_01484]|nr:GNAT family N-acetyltransferase [Kribbella sp. NBC_01484]
MIEIRKAELAEVDAVRQIGVTTWPVAYAGLASDEFITDGIAQWWSPEVVEWGIRNGITLVAAEGDDLVGMVGLGREGDSWVMWKLYVLPEHQGKGSARHCSTPRSPRFPKVRRNCCWTSWSPTRRRSASTGPTGSPRRGQPRTGISAST